MFNSRRDGPSSIEKDYLVRQLKQLLEALVKKLAQGEASPDARGQEELRNICREQLGLEYDAIAQLNVSSMAMMLSTPERVEAYALLLEAEAEQWRHRGDTTAAASLDARAESLRAATT